MTEISKETLRDLEEKLARVLLRKPVKEVSFKASYELDKCVISDRVVLGNQLFARAKCISHIGKSPEFADGIWIKKSSSETMEFWRVVGIAKIKKMQSYYVRKELFIIKILEIPYEEWKTTSNLTIVH